MKIWKKKLALFLSFIMMLTLAIPFYGKGMEAEAGSKKATLVTKKQTAAYGENLWTFVQVKNCNPKAKYSASISPKKNAEVFRSNMSEDGTSLSVAVQIKKKGTFKVTVKETLGKKTRKVGVCTIKASKPKEMYVWSREKTMVKGQQYNVYGDMSYGTKTGMSFKTTNPSVARVNKYGVVEARKAGTCTLFVRQNGKTEKVNITVTSSKKEETRYKKLKKINDKVDKLYKKKITKKNYASWYNEYCSLAKDSRKYTYALADSGRYTLDDCRKKLAAFMKGQTKNSNYGASLEAVKLTKLSSKKLSFQLSKAVTKADMVNLLNGRGKYSKKAKAGYLFVLTRTEGQTRYIYTFTTSLKEGQRKGTAKFLSGYKYSIKTGRGAQLKSVARGKNYAYTLLSDRGTVIQRKTIKCK